MTHPYQKKGRQARLQPVGGWRQLTIVVLVVSLTVVVSACSLPVKESGNSREQVALSELGSASLRAISREHLAGLEDFTGSSGSTWNLSPGLLTPKVVAACSSPGVEAQQLNVYSEIPSGENLVKEHIEARIIVFTTEDYATNYVSQLNGSDAKECDQASWDSFGEPPSIKVTPHGPGSDENLATSQTVQSEFPNLTTRQLNATVSAFTTSEQQVTNKMRFSRGQVAIELSIVSLRKLADVIADKTLQAIAAERPADMTLKANPEVDRKVAIYEAFAEQTRPFPVLELEPGSYVETSMGSECAGETSPTTLVHGPNSQKFVPLASSASTKSVLFPTAALYPNHSAAQEAVDRIVNANPDCFNLGDPKLTTIEDHEYTTTEVDGRTVALFTQNFTHQLGSHNLNLEGVVAVVAADAFVLYFKFFGIKGDSEGMTESVASVAADLEALL